MRLRSALLIPLALPTSLAVSRPLLSQVATISPASVARVPTFRLERAGALVLSDDSVDFGRVAGGCLQDGQRAVVLSTTPRALVVLERGSSAHRMVGKGGSGPGEFEQPWALSCAGRDLVAVLEMARITVMRLSTGASATSALQPLQKGRWYQAVGVISDSAYLFRSHPHGQARGLGTSRDSVELFITHDLQNLATGAVRILAGRGEELVTARVGGGVTTAVHPFARNLLVAVGDGTIHTMDSANPKLSAFTAEGQLLRQVRFSLEPRILSGKRIGEYRAERLARARPGPERISAEAVLAETVIERALPLFDRMIAVSGGGLLLRESVVPGDASASWLELDRELRPRARLRTTASLRLLAADTLSFLGMESTPERIEIVWAARAPKAASR